MAKWRAGGDAQRPCNSGQVRRRWMEEPKAEESREIYHYLVMCEGAQDIAIPEAEKKKTRRREKGRTGQQKREEVEVSQRLFKRTMIEFSRVLQSSLQ